MSAGGIVTGFICALTAFSIGKIVGIFKGRKEFAD
jgi:hypothetical protein